MGLSTKGPITPYADRGRPGVQAQERRAVLGDDRHIDELDPDRQHPRAGTLFGVDRVRGSDDQAGKPVASCPVERQHHSRQNGPANRWHGAYKDIHAACDGRTEMGLSHSSSTMSRKRTDQAEGDAL